jgi:hypothetical protein
MTTGRVIPPFDPRENLPASFLARLESVPIQHFRLQTGEERLHHGIIKTITNATHGERDIQCPAARGERDSRIALKTTRTS